MNDETRYLTLTEVASRAGVRLSAVSNWRNRHSDFPDLQVISGKEVVDMDEIVKWLQKRKIPRNRLRPGEPLGANYSIRFLQNVGISDSSSSPVVNQRKEPPEPTWREQLWAAVRTLRGTHNTASSLEFLLGLAYVKKCQTDVWQSLLNASDWHGMRDVLAGTSLPVGADIPPVQLFGKVIRSDDPSLAEAIDLIDKIDFDEGHDGKSTAAELSEAILADLERGMGRSGGRFTPPDVARCLVELLDPRPSDRVYDPFCGSGELLSAAAAYLVRQRNSSIRCQVYGQTPQEWSWLTSTMNLALHDVEANLSTPANALQEDRFPGMTFSSILANPPFNLRMAPPKERAWPFGEPPAHNANFGWLQHVVTKLEPHGRAVVVMANGAASVSAEKELTIRKAMVDAGSVECVVALPAQLFRFTGIPTMVWILRGTDVNSTLREMLFIDARNLGTMTDRTKRRLDANDVDRIVGEYRTWRSNIGTFRGTDGFSRAVGRDEVSKNGYILTPGRYMGFSTPRPAAGRTITEVGKLRDEFDELIWCADEARTMLDASLTALAAGRRPNGDAHVVPLGTVCEVLAGPGTVHRSGSQPNWTPLVLPRNIKNDRVGNEDLDLIPPETAERMARYRLIAGDIVSARAGTLGRYGLVLEEQTGWLLGPGCVRFRPNEQVNSGYLTYYLASPAARHWLTEHATGSAIQHVNAATMREMPIWLPTIAIQQEILDVLNPLHTVTAIHSRISATTQKLRDLLVPMLMSPSSVSEVK